MNSSHFNIVIVPIHTLRPDPQNPRFHSDRQIEQIAKSIKSFGFNVPVLIDSTDKVLAGHGRILAARKLGIEKIPVIRLEHMTPAQARAFAIADNRLTENSKWDKKMLGEVLRELSVENLNFDIEATGFSVDEIETYIESLGGTSIADKVPVPIQGPVITQPGDLWLLGPHRLLCGDATKADNIQKLMNGQRANMTFTDPPYGVDYRGGAKERARGGRRKILNDDLGSGFGSFLQAACNHILAVTDGSIYICMSSSELHTLHKAFTDTGGHWSTFIIWGKQSFTLGRADYQRQYEPILYGWREGASHYWCGARDQGDIWFYDRPARNDLHPTQKPVELVMRALRNSSERGAIIFDPFLGSGTTLIAAENTGRLCFGMELDPLYVDIIIRRWQEQTGLECLHVETGKAYNSMLKLQEK